MFDSNSHGHKKAGGGGDTVNYTVDLMVHEDGVVTIQVCIIPSTGVMTWWTQ